MKIKIILFVLLVCSLNAQEVSREQIAQELAQAQRDFQTAQEMFIPWYTGPLITGSAVNVPKGKVNIQPYLFSTITYAEFSNSRSSNSIPNIYTLNPQFLFQAGFTTWLDFTLIAQGFLNWSDGHSAQDFGDTAIQFGFQLVTEKEYVPAMRLVIGEDFPTGKYDTLTVNKAAVQGTGAGIYATTVGLNISKLFWWEALHPIRMRLSTEYIIPSNNAHVSGFNAYGGGFGTRGQVDVGQTLNVDYGIEVSLTEKWVFATDIAYTYSQKSKFSGTPGTIDGVTPAVTGGASSDNLSLAPAIEYNPDDTGGFIGGFWFPVTGRNSSNFISLVLSYTKLF